MWLIIYYLLHNITSQSSIVFPTVWHSFFVLHLCLFSCIFTSHIWTLPLCQCQGFCKWNWLWWLRKLSLPRLDRVRIHFLQPYLSVLDRFRAKARCKFKVKFMAIVCVQQWETAPSLNTVIDIWHENNCTGLWQLI